MPGERDIKSDAILRLICQDSHTLHTAQGRSSSCFKRICVSETSKMLPRVRDFPPFFPPTKDMWHRLYFLAGFSRFNPSCGAERRGRKMGVSARKHTAAEGH